TTGASYIESLGSNRGDARRRRERLIRPPVVGQDTPVAAAYGPETSAYGKPVRAIGPRAAAPPEPGAASFARPPGSPAAGRLPPPRSRGLAAPPRGRCDAEPSWARCWTGATPRRPRGILPLWFGGFAGCASRRSPRPKGAGDEDRVAPPQCDGDRVRAGIGRPARGRHPRVRL